MLKVVIVGCGGISRVWFESASKMDEVQIVGLVDLNEEAAHQRAAEYNLDVPVSTNLTEMLQQTKPDLVFDLTIPEAHHDVVITALDQGCHVFGEKPLSISMKDAYEMLHKVKETGKVYAVMQNRRYLPSVRRMVRFLRSGAIGEITEIHSDFFIGAHFGGFRAEMPHPLLGDMAIHTFDIARLFSNADPLSVYCSSWNSAGSVYKGDASAVAIFSMNKDIHYIYRGSWSSEGMNTSWESSWRIIGTRGSALWDGYENLHAQVLREGSRGNFFSEFDEIELPALDPADPVGMHEGSIRSFVNSLLSGKTPETVADDNIKSFAMVQGAIESADKNRTVDISRWLAS